MRALWFAVTCAMLLEVALAGCSGGGDGEQGGGTSGSTASEAAASRGVAGEGVGETVPAEPTIALDAVEYEWRNSPERGLEVWLHLSNPGKDTGRAKGYAFGIAGSDSDPSVQGVYPWNATLTDGEPADFERGARLMYWDRTELSFFLPYKERAGCWNTLRLLVYGEDGRVIVNETHELPITGEPTGKQKIEQKLVL